MNYGMASPNSRTGGNLSPNQSTGSMAGNYKSFKEKIPGGYKQGTLQNFTPEQMSLLQQMLGMVGPESYLSRLAGGDEEMFRETEEPAFRQFAGLQGQLGSRFSGMGMGGRRSSGFQNQSTTAASNFAQDLASRRHDLQRQAIMDLMGISESLLNQRPYERFITPKEPSFLDKWLAMSERVMGAAGKSAAAAGGG